MALTKERAEEILKDAGVLMEGHFILTSGKHSGKYMQCAQILQYPHYTMELISTLKEEFQNDNADIVVAPAVGGIIVSYELARQLGIKNLFAERENGVMTFRRGFSIPEGARVIVAEDVVTTGGTVREVIELVERSGGEVVGVALLVDRSNGAENFGVRHKAAYTAEVVSYEADNCPLCKEGTTPAIKPGSRSLRGCSKSE